jgi:hypothetical protein
LLAIYVSPLWNIKDLGDLGVNLAKAPALPTAHFGGKRLPVATLSKTNPDLYPTIGEIKNKCSWPEKNNNWVLSADPDNPKRLDGVFDPAHPPTEQQIGFLRYVLNPANNVLSRVKAITDPVYKDIAVARKEAAKAIYNIAKGFKASEEALSQARKPMDAPEISFITVATPEGYRLLPNLNVGAEGSIAASNSILSASHKHFKIIDIIHLHPGKDQSIPGLSISDVNQTIANKHNIISVTEINGAVIGYFHHEPGAQKRSVYLGNISNRKKIPSQIYDGSIGNKKNLLSLVNPTIASDAYNVPGKTIHANEDFWRLGTGIGTAAKTDGTDGEPEDE